MLGVLALQRWLATHDELGTRTAATGLPLTREQKSVEFRTADLSFEVFPDSQAISGHALLGFAVRQPITKLQFDLDPELPISAIAADGHPLDAAAWHNADGQVSVTLPATKRAGDALSLAIDYAGHPHVAKRAPWEGGFVWSHTPAGKPWVATAVEGEGCDLFWPCFDNSLVEVGTVALHITVPPGLAAPANGRLTGIRHLADGRTTFDWVTHNPNNYAIALDVAPYSHLHGEALSRFGNRVPLDYWYLGERDKAKKLFAEFAPTLAFFEANIGPYPFAAEKLGVVQTPHLGMEHQTINAYGNAYKPAPEGYDWLFHHEFSHEWFGNQVTNRDWDDMWLHEGFGTYMQPLYARWIGGEMPYHATLWTERVKIANKFPIVSGHHQTESTVYDPKTGPGGDIYVKGSWVLHTLRGLIGDEAFFRATRRLVYGRPDPRPGNFTTRLSSTDEFVALAGEESRRDLKWFFDVYLRRAPLPRLVDRRDGNRVTLQWRTPGGLPFPMPVEVRVGDAIQTVAMTGGHGEVALPSPATHYILDPDSKLLRQNDAIDRFRDWTTAQKDKKPG